METHNLLQNELQMDARVSNHLREAAGWAKFLGILGLILSILLAIIAFVIPQYFVRRYSYNPYGSYGSDTSSTIIAAMTAGYLIAALLLFFISLFTLKFGSKTREALATNDQASLDKGMMNLKFIFRFYGIIAIIYLSILVLGVLLGGIGLMMKR